MLELVGIVAADADKPVKSDGHRGIQ
jgi:hypothetical protein